MPAYHSSLNDYPDLRQVGNVAVLPIRTKVRGPAPLGQSPEEMDIIDETLDLFRANSLFRNFEIKGPADRLLIVLILYVSDCLAKLGAARTVPSQIEASKSLNTLSVDNFPIPGDANFALNAHYSPPTSRQDADYLRQYLTQVRQELSARLVEKLYADGTGKPSKWWMSFQKRRFMNRSLGS
ncbi:ARP2 3 complex 21 kDa subunit [Coniophora puteana RWD-64-598 SS2]|uniref:Actin-related protein 2/3 complex subunit 3 n=1 Tax=Coniophora puteana (strain RWD-64-598) TaxID=741705 RepID=A0A5M3MT12_CONPW|nr:ARP2 3 complex 21 kDa subunit [Coniophora puteana RWD-64-598 SS2]EIW82308.1 ARP2 3 complex 21 kDa subunit [Coniophora puteana RWD-64-598 SS2]